MENPTSTSDLGRHKLLSWTIRVLRENNIRPSKRLSQNFIVDPRLLRDFLSNIERTDTVEIGCGLGTLTIFLSKVAPRVVCIEIDRRLIEVARVNVDSWNTIFLNSDASIYMPLSRQVVGNIPYHITSSILTMIARLNGVKRAVFTVQRDVAERITSPPGSRKYGRISVLLKTLFDVRIAGVYPPSSFYPRPEVEHALIVLTRLNQYDDDARALEELTRLLFTQRRRIAIRVLAKRLNLDADSELYGHAYRLLGEKRVYELDAGVLLELARLLKRAGLLSRE